MEFVEAHMILEGYRDKTKYYHIKDEIFNERYSRRENISLSAGG